MGERDPGLAPPPPPAPWLARGLVAAALVALLALVLVAGPPAPAAEADGPLLIRLPRAALAALAPARGPAILGVLSLAVAALLAGPVLERRVGPAAWPLVLLAIFGSAAWALVWSAGEALVALAMGAGGFALAYGGGAAADEPPGEIYREPEAGGRALARWLAAGALLGELVMVSPLLTLLLVPATLAVPPADRRRGLAALAIGWAAALALELLVAGPEVLTAPLAVAAASFRPSPPLAGWSMVYSLAGRNVGLVAGFAPLVLLLWLGRGGSGRRGLAATALGVAVLAALALPFDFAAGWLNLSFLPLYGALWLLPARPPRRADWVVALALSALATWPLWTPPWAAAGGDGAALSAAWPRRYLPYETSLRRLPGDGPVELGRPDVRLRVLRGGRLLAGPSRLELTGGPAELWLAAPPEIDMMALEAGPGAPSSLAVGGAEAGRIVFRPDGRVGYEVLLDRPRARHPLWFGDGVFALHLITLEGPAAGRPLRLRLLTPQPDTAAERTR